VNRQQSSCSVSIDGVFNTGMQLVGLQDSTSLFVKWVILLTAEEFDINLKNWKAKEMV
jgi:ABC-type xylose transport system permease subunit